MTKIKLEKYGDHGWEFTLNDNEYYRTNSNGYGLWVYSPTNTQYKNSNGEYETLYEYKQILGTCQFSLPNNKKRAYNQLYYEHFVRNDND